MSGNQDQVRLNYAAFVKLLPALLLSHPGEFALMRDGLVVDFFDTATDAVIAGRRLFTDKLFSVQQVTDEVIGLGSFLLAVV